MTLFYIYKFTNLHNGKSYVGLTKNTSKRRNAHLAAAKRGIDSKFYRALRKYGPESFTFEVISQKSTLEEALQDEIFWIKYNDSYIHGYNATKGGDICEWFESASECDRALIIERRADGVRRWSEGRTSEEMATLRMRVSNQWKELSDEDRTAVSKKMASRKMKRYVVTSPNGQVHDVVNLKAFCKEHNLNQGHMCGVANGRYSHSKGWIVKHFKE
jgi:group I intron endonuclease